MSEPDRHTRTGRYIRDTSRRSGYEGSVPAPLEFDPDPSFVPRLTFKQHVDKADYSFDEMCRGIEDAPPDVCFLLDTSALDDSTDQRLCPALLASSAEILITPRVLEELSPYFAARPNHPLAIGKDSGSGRVQTLDIHAWPAEIRNCYVHYGNVLAMRKRAMHLIRMHLEREQDRTPATPQEVRAELQRYLGERGYLFARKGQDVASPPPPTFFTDEEVVVSAALHALETGRNTVILTKDEDIVDQFYRLWYLIDTHYRSMLIAERYVQQFSRFRTHRMPDTDAFAEAFETRSGVIVERSENLPYEVLPKNFSFVASQCWVIGRYLTDFTFGAETEMRELLKVKGRTDGMNTSRLGARNLHLALPGLSIPSAYGHCFVIAEDRTLLLPRSNRRVPYMDFAQAVTVTEGFKRLRQRSPLDL